MIFISKSAEAAFFPTTGFGTFKYSPKGMEAGDTYPSPILHVKSLIKIPVIIQKIEILEAVGQRIIIVTSTDGLRGITILNFRMEFPMPILQEMLVPFFIGKDARDIEQILDTILHDRSVYKYSGIPLFNCIGQIEIGMMDLLGKAAGIPASDLFG